MRVIEETQSGLEHIHCIFRGRYIPQAWLSQQWLEIHGAQVVWIEALYRGDKGKHSLAGYLTKYMTKDLARRYSWDWTWVYRGFVATWRLAKSYAFQTAQNTGDVCWMAQFLRMWHSHLASRAPPDRWLQWLQVRAFIAARSVLPTYPTLNPATP